MQSPCRLEESDVLSNRDSAATQGHTRKHYDINDYLQHRSVSYNNSDTVQPWQFFFKGEVCFKYEPAPNETLREAILESFLSTPEILREVGAKFYQSVLPSCRNQETSFELVRPYAKFSAPSTPNLIFSFLPVLHVHIIMICYQKVK